MYTRTVQYGIALYCVYACNVVSVCISRIVLLQVLRVLEIHVRVIGFESRIFISVCCKVNSELNPAPVRVRASQIHWCFVGLIVPTLSAPD